MKSDHIADEALPLVTAVALELAALSREQLQAPLARAVVALVHDHICEGKPVYRPTGAQTIRGEVRGNLITIVRERAGGAD